jgi:hypothetical protein
VTTARLRGGGDLPLAAFASAGAALLLVDVAVAATVHDDRIGSIAYWSAVAIGVTLLAMCPYRPPRDLITLAVAHALVVTVVLVVHHDSPSVQPFAVLVDLSAAVIPAAAAAQFVRHYVRAVVRRQDAVAEQARAQSRVAAAAAVQEDSDRRLARLRTEVLPFLDDVAAGRRPVDDEAGAELAQRLSAQLRRELVEARSGAWLLAAPVAAFAGTSRAGSSEATDTRDDGWPGIVLLDPQRLVARLAGRDRAALSAVLAAVRSVGGWTSVSVALSVVYGEGEGAGGEAAGEKGTGGEATDAFVTVVALGERALDDVDARVAAAAERAGCVAAVEPPSACVVEGRLPLRPSARLER